MSQHARPHLETHSRSKDHSAVAGAAYRLGLRLYCDRTKVWHDYRKRELGEEIVRALTVAPIGAPAWATDAAQLWNRVEAAELRKDAQVARDYRIPIPFGLTDDQAGDLSEEMARFICEELHTPVSIGLHRDADRDVLGNVKPNDKQGFHAHLYFPTRKLADVDSQDGKAGGGGSSGFGEKLTVLSNKRTSVAFVEAMNAKWATLANQYTSISDLPADYDHRSYKRMGLNLTPQPTMGRAVTAMERKGVETRMGDHLREALVMAQTYERAHQVAMDAQRAQALADVVRESGRKEKVGRPSAPAFISISSYPVKKSGKVPPSTSTPTADPLLLNPINHGSLASVLLDGQPKPSTSAEKAVFHRLFQLVNLIERFLSILEAKLKEVLALSDSVERAKAYVLESKFQADRSREHRASAQKKAIQWKHAHPWRAKLTTMGGSSVMHVEQQKIHFQIQLHDGHVQTLKKSIKAQEVTVLEVGRELAEVKAECVEHKRGLRKAVEELAKEDGNILQRLLVALPMTQRDLVKAEMPDRVSDDQRKTTPTQISDDTLDASLDVGESSQKEKPTTPSL